MGSNPACTNTEPGCCEWKCQDIVLDCVTYPNNYCCRTCDSTIATCEANRNSLTKCCEEFDYHPLCSHSFFDNSANLDCSSPSFYDHACCDCASSALDDGIDCGNSSNSDHQCCSVRPTDASCLDSENKAIECNSATN